MKRAANKVDPVQKQQYVLKLYVTGASRASQRAIENLNSICHDHLEGRYELEVVDVFQAPEVTKEENILAAPTLVKHLPLPVRRLIGDLSQRNRVLVLLDLKPRA